jgi:hypothetical protein
MNFSKLKGEGKSGLIFGIALLLLAGYIALKVIPVMIHVYAFEDRVREECKFLHGRSMDGLERDIINAAKVEEIELYDEDIDAQRIHVNTYEVLRVKVNYSVPIATPIKVFTWNRAVNYEAPIFE